MDLASQLILGIIFGVVGFIIGKLCGFNPATAAADIGAIIVILPLIVIIFRVSVNPESGLNALGDMINWFVNYWPGIVIGEITGNIVGAVTGEN